MAVIFSFEPGIAVSSLKYVSAWCMLLTAHCFSMSALMQPTWVVFGCLGSDSVDRHCLGVGKGFSAYEVRTFQVIIAFHWNTMESFGTRLIDMYP